MSATPSPEIVALSGEIDLHRSPEVKELLAPFLRRPARLLLDFTGVSYIDSSGLAVLIETLQGVRINGGQLAIFGLQESVENIFEIARLDQIFPIFPSEAAALAGAW